MLRVLVLVAVVVAASTFVACDAEAPPGSPTGDHPASLAGTSWTVVAIGGIAVPRGAEPMIGFDATTAKGSGGCNSFGGSYGYEPATGELRFESLGMTAMACAEPARNQVETAFIQALSQPFLVVTLQPDGHLVIRSAAGPQLDLAVVGRTIID